METYEDFNEDALDATLFAQVKRNQSIQDVNRYHEVFGIESPISADTLINFK